MAFSEKYFIPYCNAFGANCRVSILFNNYVGTSREVTGQPKPFLKSYDSDDFKFEPIQPSTGRVNMVFGTGDGIDFEEFWEADEKTIKVEHYISGSLDWVGFVIPDGFSYEFTGGKYYASIRAADGLSTLENLKFEFSDGVPYGTQNLTYNNGFSFPFSLIITEILKKLDLGLNTWIGVDVFERSMTRGTNSRNSDPLSQSFADVRTYINDSERKDIAYWQDPETPMNCMEIMESLCRMFGAKVYQNKGVWRFKRINIDINRTNKYFHIYNTSNVHIGRELIGNDVIIPCATIAKAMIGNDHLMYMDEVLKAYRMNYKYRFKRTGDVPIQLIRNGMFAIFNNTSRLSAPEHWVRYADPGRWNVAMRRISIAPTDAGGFTTGILLGEQAPGMPTNNLDKSAKPWRSLMQGGMQVTKGDKITFSLWQRITGQAVHGTQVRDIYLMIYRLSLMPDDRYRKSSQSNTGGRGATHFLMNESKRRDVDQMEWMPASSSKGDHANMFAVGGLAKNTQNVSDAIWRNYELLVPELPESGYLFLEIIGQYKMTGQSGDNNPSIQVKGNGGDYFKMYNVRDDHWNEPTILPYPRVTGIMMGFIPEPDALPEKDYYIYENIKSYSLQRDPEEVLNGDTLDDKHISAILVPSNTSGGRNFWLTQNNDYAPSTLGLQTVKSIMQLYYKPFRILEGDIKCEAVNIDTRFEFEALPGKKFMLQKAVFNEKKNYIEDGKFFEIASVDDVLPDGGIENGNTLNPDLQFTGNIRCKKDGSGVNTGIVEGEYMDINEASETFRQRQWRDEGEDLTMCPIGLPSPYFWGCDDSIMEISNLTDFTYNLDGDVVQCPYSNSGGLYIYFVHLSSLGVVENVFIDMQDRIISDFSYLADITHNGYTYKVLRQNYITAEFSNLPINFQFA